MFDSAIPWTAAGQASLVHHQLLKFTRTHVHWVSDAIQPSHPLLSPSPNCLQSFPASRSFQMSQFFAWGGQSTGVSASASVLPMSIQVWFPLGLTGLISLLFKGLSRVFSNSFINGTRPRQSSPFSDLSQHVSITPSENIQTLVFPAARLCCTPPEKQDALLPRIRSDLHHVSTHGGIES